MKSIKLEIKYLENQKDVDAYQANANGMMVLKPKSFVVSECENSDDKRKCGNIPFIQYEGGPMADEMVKAYIDDQLGILQTKSKK